MKRTIYGLIASTAIVASAGIGLASSASAHEVPPIPNRSPLKVLSNLGNGLDYALNHTQHEHVDAPLVGLGPALTDPVGYTGGHVLPFAIDVVERLGGISSDDHGTGGTGGGGHDH